MAGIGRYRLDLPGGRVDFDDVVAAVSELVGFAAPEGLRCLAPWENEQAGHPDHDAVARAAITGEGDLGHHRIRRLLLSEPVRLRKRHALRRVHAAGPAAGPHQVAAAEVFLA